MTVSNTQATITLPGNGVVTVFTYPFEIPYQDDGTTPAANVSVLIGSTTTVLTPSQYSITGVGLATGGTITYPLSGAPLPVGATITTARAKALTQPYAFPNQSFVPSEVEAALDNILLELQQGTPQGTQTITGTSSYPVVGSFGYVDTTGTFSSNPGFLGAIASGSGFQIPAGIYSITANMAFPKTVSFVAGAVLKVATGVTITFNGEVIAPLSQIFTNATASLGTVNLSPQNNCTAYPEWWGAQTDNAAVDCKPAITSALASGCPVVQLQAADYWTLSAIVHSFSYVSLRGVGSNGVGPNPSTRIIVQSTTADVLVLGTIAQPASINSFVTCAEIHDVSLVRTGVMTSGGISPNGSACAGLRISFVLACIVRNVWSSQSVNSFYVTGAVNTHLYNCSGNTYYASSGGTGDFRACYLLDYSANIGLNAGNASLYIQDCSGSIQSGLGLTNSCVIYTYEGFTDTYIDHFESSGGVFGIVLNANVATNLSGENFRMTNSVFDQCTGYGMIISGASAANLNADVSDNYFGIPTGAVGIYVLNFLGQLSLSKNQIIGGGSLVGISLSNCKGIDSVGNRIMGLLSPIIWATVGNSRCEDSVTNDVNAVTTAAFVGTSVTRSRLAPFIKGGAAKIPKGITLDSTSTSNEVKATGFDPAVLTGALATNKIFYNGATWGGGTTFGTGNVVTGVLT